MPIPGRERITRRPVAKIEHAEKLSPLAAPLITHHLALAGKHAETVALQSRMCFPPANQTPREMQHGVGIALLHIHGQRRMQALAGEPRMFRAAEAALRRLFLPRKR